MRKVGRDCDVLRHCRRNTAPALKGVRVLCRGRGWGRRHRRPVDGECVAAHRHLRTVRHIGYARRTHASVTAIIGHNRNRIGIFRLRKVGRDGDVLRHFIRNSAPVVKSVRVLCCGRGWGRRHRRSVDTKRVAILRYDRA